MLRKKKKTNLGKVIHTYNSVEEMIDSAYNDAKAFAPEMNDILVHFDDKNPYDIAVLELVFALFFANATVKLEDEFPEFRENVLTMYDVYCDDLRQVLENKKQNKA